MTGAEARSPLPLPAEAASFDAPGDWQAIDLLSDLHLAAATPRTFDAWAAHLRSTTADAVFILGDLFEAWIGDDLATRGFEQRCVDVLTEAGARVTVGFMAGNRDFLVGDALLQQAGVLRLHDPTLVNAFGTRTLLSHGDALCVDDVAYQRWRAIVRRPFVQSAFLALPMAWRSAAGRALRQRSDEGAMGAVRPASADPKRHVDLDAASTLGWARSAEAPHVVHGHTHAPASHELAPGVTRIVLSDWDLDHPGTPRAEVLRWTVHGFARIAPEAG